MPDVLIWQRYLLGALALALAAIALPMAASETLRTATLRSAPAAATLHAEAAFGWLRGDLWGGYALAEAKRIDAGDAATLPEFRRAAQWALSLAPYQPQLWLRLAKLDATDPTKSAQFNAVLKMAYYTAPADDPGMADRLQMALSALGPPDEELDELARSDVRAMIVHGRLRELAVVYQSLGGGARAFVERAVTAIQPDLAPRLAAPD
jgi:hypothetical protein